MGVEGSVHCGKAADE